VLDKESMNNQLNQNLLDAKVCVERVCVCVHARVLACISPFNSRVAPVKWGPIVLTLMGKQPTHL